jgi:hypothetical protein
MTFRVEVVGLSDGGEQRCSVVEMERAALALETLGVSVAEDKAILPGLQEFMTGQQAIEDLIRKRACPTCGRRYTATMPAVIRSRLPLGRSRYRIRGGSAFPTRAKGH